MNCGESEFPFSVSVFFQSVSGAYTKEKKSDIFLDMQHKIAFKVFFFLWSDKTNKIIKKYLLLFINFTYSV